MNRLKLIALLMLSSFLLFSAPAAQPQRPNFVFVLVDDLRIGTLGYEGHPFSKTPNIDRIAHEGAICRNAFVTTPLCSPARGTFLTGQYVHTHGVKDNADYQTRSHELVTFPMLLREGGYETAYVGKWHMGNHDEPKPGFDQWISFKGQGVYENPMININGKTQKVEGYTTDILNDYAVEFLKRDHQKPFVLFLGHKAVHGPFTPAERHKQLYANESIPHGPPSLNDSSDEKIGVQKMREQERKEGRNVRKTKSETSKKASFNGPVLAQLRCLKAIDEGVGKMIAALEETKQFDNTVFIFTSDNGYFWGEHGLGDKRWAYEEGIRIPMAVRYPKLIKAGTKFDQTILNVDIAPTFLELAGVSIPKAMQGKSLIPVFSGHADKWRDAALFEYFVDRQYPRFPEWQAVRTTQWKFIHYPELPNADELYDLKADPYEMKNVADDNSAKKTLAEMKAQLDRLLADTKP